MLLSTAFDITSTSHNVSVSGDGKTETVSYI